ncbi:MAG: DMT family transporter [Bacteroidota bacterium]
MFFWLFLSIFSWGSSFVAVKIGLNGLNPFELATYRFTVASLILIPIALASNFKLPAWNDFKLILILAVLGVYAYHLTLNYATLNFSPNSISFVANASPVFTTLFAIIFLNEKVRPLGWVGLIVSLIGVYGITNSGIGLSLSVDSLILILIPILWGIFFLLQKPLLSRLRPLEVMSYSIWIGTVLFLCYFNNLSRKATAVTD